MRTTFTDQKSRAFTLLQPGVYAFTVVDAAEGYATGSRFTGSPQIDMTLAVWATSAPEAGAPHATTVLDSITAHPDLQWKSDTFLRSVGWRKPDGTPPEPNDDIDITCESLIGLTGLAEFSIRDYTKKDGSKGQANQVKRYIHPDEAKKLFAGVIYRPQPAGKPIDFHTAAKAAAKAAEAPKPIAPKITRDADGLPF